MNNYINRTFWFTLVVAGILLLLHYLPPITLFGYQLREVDLLSDVRLSGSSKEKTEEDAIALIAPFIKPEFIDTCQTGLVCIEDYSDSTNRGIKPFYETLNKRTELKRPVRIAFFGDSFIEADILTGELRNLLQIEYGGCGVGFVPITSPTNGFRPTVKHSFRGWGSHTQIDTIYFERSKQGIAGCYFIPTNGAYVELRGAQKMETLDTCDIATIYFASDSSVEVESLVNGRTKKIHRSLAEQFLQRVEVKDSISNIRWTVKNAKDALFYGVAMDGIKGISLDNFSIRGSSGLSLRGIPENILKQFNTIRPYDLIVLQYGLNVATQRGVNYDKYKQGMMSTIAYLKKCFPNAGILLMSVGDRNYKTSSGNYKTMPGVQNLVLYQQAIAMESNIAFWNLYEAMGGEGSMEKLVNSKPPKANRDYTHINFQGGKEIAEILHNTLVYGKEHYDRRREHGE